MKDEKSIAIDFDGVIHSFTSGWQGPRVISDPPTNGAILWLKEMIALYDVQIYSARNYYWGGKRAIKKWLWQWSLTDAEISKLSFPKIKPIAKVIIDDRAICFRGVFPDPKTLEFFVPWHGKSIFGDK